MASRKLRTLTALAALLSAVGAMSWGLTALNHFNIVHSLFGKRRLLERIINGLIGLAGAWTVFQLAMPALITGLSARRRGPAVPTERRSILGQRLPTLEGQALSGRHVRLPDDAAGKVALVAMGFAYSARWAVEDWVDAFNNRFAHRKDVTFYEIPMIGGVARLAAPMIETAMRSATPDSLQDHVVTIYGSMGSIREALGVTNESDAWIFLIDPDGTVLFESRGSFDAARLDRLASVAELALSSGQARGGPIVA